MSFGDRVKQRRKTLKLTQKALANKVGISRSAVNSWEMGDHIPGGKPAQLLPEALQCNWQWLETGKGHPEAVVESPVSGVAAASADYASTPIVAKHDVVKYLNAEPVKTRSAPIEIASVISMLRGSRSVFAVEEDSPGMSPRILPGEIVLIDPEAVSPAGEWVFDIDGEIVIGVVNKTPKGLMLSFYNDAPGWEPVPVTQDQSIGKVLASLPVF